MNGEHPSFELIEPERFTAGTVGEPGRRVFFLQAEGNGRLVTLKCEKQQVGALAEYLAGILADLPLPPAEEVAATTVDFVEPPAVHWVVGRMGVAWDDGADQLILQCEELVLADEDADDPDEPGEPGEPGGAGAGMDDDELLGFDESRATARFRLTRAQVAAFVMVARNLVAAGRPPCYLCGGPVDPSGHVCPRLN